MFNQWPMYSGVECAIICFVGASGAGKSTLCSYLESELPARRLLTSTTRMPRSAETDGIDYRFLRPDVFEWLSKYGYGARRVVVNIKYGSYRYGVLRGDLLDATAGQVACCCLTPHGYSQLLSFVSSELPAIRPVKIGVSAPLHVRISRMRARGTPTTEIFRRVIADASAGMGAYCADRYVRNDDTRDIAYDTLMRITRAILGPLRSQML